MSDKMTTHMLDLPPGGALPEFRVEVPAPAGTRAGQILRSAAGIVDGARNQTHGDKERSFAAIATMWNGYIGARPYGVNASLTAADVSAMMVLLKFARSMHGRHVEDHGVDAAGYASIWAELREAEDRPHGPPTIQQDQGPAPDA